jgi:4'-phosphopantetheinyl transferase
MIQIWYTDIRFPIFKKKGIENLLSRVRRRKIGEYHFQADRLRCLAGGLLIEQAVRGKDIFFGSFGKPYVPGGPFFNLSHSGNYVILALSEVSPLGIDIEKQREDDYLALAEQVFHLKEMEFFLKTPGKELFFTLWTLKESYIKMTGLGFSLDSRRFSVLPWLDSREPPFFHTLTFIPGYSIALCTGEKHVPARTSLQTQKIEVF